jgi:circadian clock protein KaiC
LLTTHGVEFKDVYVGTEGVLTGSMRLAQEARDEATATMRQKEIERRQRDIERKRAAMEAQTAALRGQFEAEQEELQRLIDEEQSASDILRNEREQMAASRKADDKNPLAKTSIELVNKGKK